MFCDEYLIHLNATKAYKSAYPNVTNNNTAKTNGSRLLTKANVSEYISDRLAEKKSSLIATQDEVLERLTEIMRGESNEIKIADSLKAAELLGKYHTLFTDKVQVDGAGIVQIINDIPKDVDDG